MVLAALGLSAATVFARHKASAKPEAGPDAGTLSQECYAEVGPVLQRAGGTLTPAVRNAYLNWAEKTVLEKLRQSNQAVPKNCLAEARREGTLRDAMFGSVFPPDPSILQNYAQLRAELGEAFLAKYRSLVIAAAVAKRIKGVETGGSKDIGRDYNPGHWYDRGVQVPRSEAENDFVRHIADFMRVSRVSATALFQDAGLQEMLRRVLANQNVPSGLIGEVKMKSYQFGERLKYAMVLLGQRPAARDPNPITTAWLRHLVAINEAKPTSTPTVDGKALPWPLFPIDKAPWPLLMPLAYPVPPSEANYIWEAFQGQHGPDRYHTYGPYKEDEEAMFYCLTPSKWFWDAWPDRIVHGGVCYSLSLATVLYYSALGKPAMWAAQPGHCNLISFQYIGGAWTAENEQAFAGGSDVTCAEWYFDEDKGTQIRFRDDNNWPFAEYHFGLVLAMNVGLKSYMDTRMAEKLFGVLPAADKPTLGVKLLRSVLLANPFNPAIWYRLADQTPDGMQDMALTEAALAGDPSLLFNHSGNINAANKKKRNNAYHGGGEVSYWYWRIVPRYSMAKKIAGTKLAIVKATYGDLPRGASADVTNKVQGMLKDNLLTVDASNDNFGNPAGDIRKKLKVDFTVDAKAHSLTVNEYETLKIEVAPVKIATIQPGKADSVKAIKTSTVQSREEVAEALLGKWEVEKTNGYHGTWTFTSDGKVTNSDRHSLTTRWTIESGAVMIRWNSKLWESLTLPIDPAGSTGPCWQGTAKAVKVK